MSSKPAPPVPPAGPPAVKRAPEPMARMASYCSRSSGSESTEFASVMSLNFFSAAASPGFWSGWYLRASLRYAFLTSSGDASLETPRTL